MLLNLVNFVKLTVAQSIIKFFNFAMLIDFLFD